MLNVERGSPTFAFPISRDIANPRIDFRSLVKANVRHRRLIAISTGACIVAGLLFALLAKPVYTAEGMLQIDARRVVQPPGRSSGAPEMTALDSAAIDSQVEILKSDQLSRDVITKLGLVTNPDFSSPSLIGSALTAIKRLIRGQPEATDDIPSAILKSFAERLDIKRLRDTYMVAIHFKAGTPELAATVTNVLMKTYLDHESDSRRNSIKLEITWLDERLASLRDDIATADKALRQASSGAGTQVDVSKLQREVESYRSIYQVFLDRYTASVQQMSFPFAQANIIAGARPPQDKSFPNTFVVLALSALGGLIIGVGITTFLELNDDTFRTPQQTEATLGRPVIGVLPPLTETVDPSNAGSPATPALLLRNAHRYAADRPMSRFVEGLRGLKTAVDAGLYDNGSRTLGVMSALPDEGASILAANLAYLIARGGKTVLLVDADQRAKTLTSALHTKNERDLADVLSDRSTLAEATWALGKNIAFIGSNQLLKPSEGYRELDPLAIQHFIDQAALEYDYVIVCLPPMAPLADLQAFAPAMGGLALVVRWGVTSQRMVRNILNVMPLVQDKVLGVVLSGVDLHRMAADTQYPLAMSERSSPARGLFSD
ncbi:uncharacterized protein involved in exopolysaccharide biosynthesis/Mrp family chromosome partitioning ATPase [Nitrobacteraceae bacterium AZCC 2146]